MVNLGLIYGIDIEGDHATIKMTLTIVGCPLSTYLQNAIEKAVLTVPEIKTCDVKLVWYPVWSPERMTTAAKQQLGMLDDEQALDQEEEIEDTEEKQRIIDFSVPIKKLAEEYPISFKLCMIVVLLELKFRAYYQQSDVDDHSAWSTGNEN